MYAVFNVVFLSHLPQVQEQLANQDNNITSTTGPNTIITDIDDDIAVADDNGFSTMEESSVLNCTFQADQDNGAQSMFGCRF